MLFRKLSIIVLICILYSCKRTYEVAKNEQTLYILSDTSFNKVDSTVLGMIAPYRKVKDSIMSSVLAESDFAMVKDTPEGSLGNFVADACLAEAQKIYFPADRKMIDFAFFNNGGLRRSLPAGKITRGDVYELMPFENELVVLTLNSETVKKIFNFIATKGGDPVSGVRFEIKNTEAINVVIKDSIFDTTKTYKVLTSDYLANGGDSYSFLSLEKPEALNLKVRDAIIRNLTTIASAGKRVHVQTDGRIKNAN